MGIPEGATAIGCPAKVVGKVREEEKPGQDMDTALDKIECNRQCHDFKSLWSSSVAGGLSSLLSDDAKSTPTSPTKTKSMDYRTCQSKLMERHPNLTPYQVDSVTFLLDRNAEGRIREDLFYGNEDIYCQKVAPTWDTNM